MNAQKKPFVIVGMSGGVDSSVAAMLLQAEGYHVEGLFMKNWEEDDTDSYCNASQDVADAQAVCDILKIKLHTANFASEYWDNVFTYFLEEYKNGRTPNPDILCNKEIKFKALLDYIKHLGADFLATGHYADISFTDNKYLLKKPLDRNKDQTYFLYTLNQQQLQYTLFPLAHYDKPAVRKLAKAAGLPNNDKKDSTGICFIGERNFKNFLQQYLPAQPGNIITTDNDIIGQHDGLMYYTLGQRQGLKIGGTSKYSGDPWYVADKNLADNTLVVVQGDQHPLLFKQELDASQLHWITAAPSEDKFKCHAKVRYRQQEQSCTVHMSKEDKYHIVFDEPQRSITPGQSVVLYNGDICLGGGVINSY